MRNSHQTSCNCRGVAFSHNAGTDWSSISYANPLKDPICQGSTLSSQNYTYFTNPSMVYARSNLTIHYKPYSKTDWKHTRITDELCFSDYSSLAHFTDASTHKNYLGVVWGSCKVAVPFRVWCMFEHSWEILFTRVFI